MQSTTGLCITVFGILILCNSIQASVNPGESTRAESESQKMPRCTFRDRYYLPGEVWHANTSSPHCVMCVCLQTGKLNCTKLECCSEDSGGRSSGSSSSSSEGDSNLSEDLESATKRESRLKSDVQGSAGCCETCGKRSSAIRSSTVQTTSLDDKDSSSHYYDEETDDDPLVKANLEHVSCLHQGKIYRDREVFAANMSALPIGSRERDHCMHCVCQGGMVLCTMKPCSGFDCANTNVTSKITEACCDYCHKCNADRQSVNKKAASEIGQKPKLAERSGLRDMNDIADAQYLYTSITATEQDGAATTTSGNSQEVKHFTVNHRLLSPTKRAGCISAGKFHFHGSTWHPVIGPFGSMECVICKCLHSRIECSRLPCPTAPDSQCLTLVKLEGHCCPTCVFPSPSDNGSKQLCVPVYQDVTVYKSQDYFSENDTEVTTLSFVRVKGNWNPKFQVEIHEWTLEKGKIFRFYTINYTNEEFLKIQKAKTSLILGVTTSRNLEKFTKREKKLHFRCKSQCNVRIQSLQLTLRLHELVPKPKCSIQERSIL